MSRPSSILKAASLKNTWVVNVECLSLHFFSSNMDYSCSLQTMMRYPTVCLASTSSSVLSSWLSWSCSMQSTGSLHRFVEGKGRGLPLLLKMCRIWTTFPILYSPFIYLSIQYISIYILHNAKQNKVFILGIYYCQEWPIFCFQLQVGWRE